MTAEFDGHGVGTRLRTRYHGYSTQKLESYKKLIKELRHTAGTSMPVHVDRFETIIGHMPGCGYIPTTLERVDWFLPSVAEPTYAAAKAHCQAKKLTGGLEYVDMIKLYNHTCFEKYPHFQLAELQNSKLSQNSNRIRGKPSCIYHPNSNHSTSECEKLKSMNEIGKGKGNPNKKGYGNRSSQKGKGRGQKSNGKGKGRGKGTGTPAFSGECTHCGKTGHTARDCYSRKRASGTQTFQQNQQKVANEATLQFSQFAVHTTVDTPPIDTHYETNSEGGSGTESEIVESDEENSEHEICDVNFLPIDEVGSSSEDTTPSWRNHYNHQSSDITNTNSETRTERLRLFHTWGEKPTMETEPKGPDTSTWNNGTPDDWIVDEKDGQHQTGEINPRQSQVLPNKK
jgi:hypothetical protein